MEKLTKYIVYIYILLIGCKTTANTQKEVYQDLEFKDELLQDFYIVDTVEIKNAFIIQQEEGDNYIKFLTKNDSLKTIAIDENVYLRPDIFLLSHCLFCHFETIDESRVYDYEACNETTFVSEEGFRRIYKFNKNSDSYIIALMNISYFNNRHSSLHSTVFINTKNYKSAYMKVIFPYCK